MRTALWPNARDEHPDEIDAYLKSPDTRATAFVAADPARSGLAGFLEVRLRNYADGCSSSPVAYIEGWYVDPESRRRGVGAALVEAAALWARNLGLSEMASDSELHNAVSQRAHGRLGFEEVGRVVQFRKRLRPAVREGSRS